MKRKRKESRRKCKEVGTSERKRGQEEREKDRRSRGMQENNQREDTISSIQHWHQ